MDLSRIAERGGEPRATAADKAQTQHLSVSGTREVARKPKAKHSTVEADNSEVCYFLADRSLPLRLPTVKGSEAGRLLR